MKIGYARVSLKGQTLSSQIEALKKAGCDKIFEDRNNGDYQELQKALNSVKKGDIFMITRLDRCAKNVKELHSIIEKLNAKNVSLETIEQDLDTSTDNGKIMIGFLSTITEFERDLHAERQAIGIKAAQKKGIKFGREAIFDDVRTAEAIELQKKDMTNQEIADKFGIARSTLLKYISNYKKTLDWEDIPPPEKKKRHFNKKNTIDGRKRKKYTLNVYVLKKPKRIYADWTLNARTNSINYKNATLRFNSMFYEYIIGAVVNPVTNTDILEDIYHIVTGVIPTDKYELESMLEPYLDALYQHTPKAIDTSSLNFPDPFNAFAPTYKGSSIPNLPKVEAPVEDNSTENNDEFDIYEALGFEDPNKAKE